MAKRQIFYSFHFDNDVMRVQQIRQIGAIEGNMPVSINNWEEVERQGPKAIKQWIDDNMKYRSCVVVLVGSETAQRPWVKYEIEKAWNDKKGVVGIYIHNLKCPRNGFGLQGANPFQQFNLQNGNNLANIVKCYNPKTYDAYNDIAKNLESLIEDAITIRNRLG